MFIQGGFHISRPPALLQPASQGYRTDLLYLSPEAKQTMLLILRSTSIPLLFRIRGPAKYRVYKTAQNPTCYAQILVLHVSVPLMCIRGSVACDTKAW